MTARVAIVTDSTADLTPELLERHSITAVPLTVTLDGASYLDGVEITAGDFYAKLTPASTTSTSQPSPGRFAETYQKLLGQHEAVVSVHISGRLSGTLDSARQAAAMIGGDRIRVIDSKVVSMPLGLIALTAATAAAEGGAAAAIEALVERISAQATAYFTVQTLEHLRRGGRIGRASAFLGSVLQVKPVLGLRDGEVVGLERVRTREKAIARVLELARQVGGGGRLCAIVGHAADPEDAERLARELEPQADTLLINPLGPVVGAHAGPGTVGIGCYPASLFPLRLKEMAGSRP